MRRFSILLTLIFTCLSLFSTAAEANRYGSGRNLDKQHPANSTRKAIATAPGTAPAQNSPQWLGALAGSGLSGAMGGILLALLAAGALAFILPKWKKPQPATTKHTDENQPGYPPAAMPSPSWSGIRCRPNDSGNGNSPARIPG